MLKCRLSYPTLLSSHGSRVAVPQAKVIINKARPAFGWRSPSSHPSVQIPYFLTPSQLQYC